MHLALWEPPLREHGGEHDAPVRRTATAETASLLTDLVVEGVRTLAFVRSRRGAEAVAMTTRDTLAEVDPDLVVPDPELSLADGAIAPWAGGQSADVSHLSKAAAHAGGSPPQTLASALASYEQ